MRNNKIIISVICIIMALAAILGVVIIYPKSKDGNYHDTESDPIIESTYGLDEITDSNTTSDNDETRQTLIEHEETHSPIPDLNEGNEIYLDMDVVQKLSELEASGREDEVNIILDTMLLLINEFVDKGYTKTAISQIQRFYFAYSDSMTNIDFADLCQKIENCIAKNGAVAGDFERKVGQNFGIDDTSYFEYILGVGVSNEE